MKKYSLSFKNVQDPYAFLAELVIVQALSDIRCYYNKEGTREEQISGHHAETWIIHMNKTFQLYASATQRPIEEFHQWCLLEIDRIKEEASARLKLAKETQQGQVGGEADTFVV